MRMFLCKTVDLPRDARTNVNFTAVEEEVYRLVRDLYGRKAAEFGAVEKVALS